MRVEVLINGQRYVLDGNAAYIAQLVATHARDLNVLRTGSATFDLTAHRIKLTTREDYPALQFDPGDRRT